MLVGRLMGFLEDALRKTFIRPLGERIHNARLRKRLRNDNFTILCPNCIGGTMYRKLGKEFLSPTINLWMTQGDFIKFAVHLEDYIAMSLDFQKTDKTYPVAMLGDIRINYDNLYILLYYREGYTLDQIRQIEQAKCRNLILLTPIPLPLDYACCIKPRLHRPNGDSFLDDNIWGTRTFEKQWDFVGWLNTER